jgi:tetratricopeptide (TPR) repeat protein
VRAAVTALLLMVLVTPARGETRAGKTGESPDQLRVQAIELFQQGNYRKAVPILEELLKIDPNDATAIRYLLIYRQQVLEPYCKAAAEAYFSGNYRAAIEQWERILQIEPGHPEIQRLINETVVVSDREVTDTLYANVTSFMKEGQHKQASAELEKIIQINPGEKRARELLAIVNRTVTDTAIKDLYEKGEEHVAREDYDRAVEQWQQILVLDPTQELASRKIANIQRQKLDDMYAEARKLYRQGDYTAARDAYSRILSVNPTDPSIKRTIDRLGKTIQVAPKVTGEGKVWSVLRRGMNHYLSENGNPRVAIAAVWYAAQLEPNNDTVLALRGFIETENSSAMRAMEPPAEDMNIIEQNLFAALNNIYEGRYDIAVQQCQLVLSIEPNNVLALKRLGSAYFALGRRGKARETWQRALKLSPGDAELRAFIRQTQ